MDTRTTQGTASQKNSNELKRIFNEKLLTNIFRFYEEQSLIDVTFKVSNPASFVPAHRLILSAASPYFEDLFNSDRGNNPVIEINDIDSDIFESLITFCYTGQALVTVENVAAMLKAAIVLQLEDAATTCVDYLMAHINECTLQGAYALERETQYELLKQKIREYEIQNFMEISQHDEFLNFEVEKLQCLLESDNLNIAREKDAFDAITRWFNHNVSARREQLPRLVSCLRLTQFDVDFLLTHIQALPGCELLAFMASMWIREPAARTKLNIRFTKPRVGVNAGDGVEKTLLALYKEAGKNSPCVLQYDKTEDKWQEYASINNFNIKWSAVLKDDNILFLGGTDQHGNASNTVLSWNIRNKTWKEMPAMNQARRLHSVVELDGKIYAIGGRGNDDTLLQSVERYTTSNGWEFVKPLFTARHSGDAVCLNGKIYVVGGWNQTRLKSVECYNPDTKTWTLCADMTEYRRSPGIAAHNGQIYIVADISNHDINTVERYDPQRDTWTTICSLESGGTVWSSIACASLDNKLWAIGGRVGAENNTTVAAYDEENDGWIQKSLLPKCLIYSCFVVPVSVLVSK